MRHGLAWRVLKVGAEAHKVLTHMEALHLHPHPRQQRSRLHPELRRSLQVLGVLSVDSVCSQPALWYDTRRRNRLRGLLGGGTMVKLEAVTLDLEARLQAIHRFK